jgi:hypothetical protein
MDIITDPTSTIRERFQAIEFNAHLDITLLKLEYEGTIYNILKEDSWKQCKKYRDPRF